MRDIILDTSVAAKWLFSEEVFSEQAANLCGKLMEKEIRAFVPEFFYLELANVCASKLKKNLVNFGEAAEFLARVTKIPLKRYPDFELSDLAFDNAAIYNISAYDALYLSLSAIYGAPLITADEKLLRACKDKFDFIEHLRDFKVR